MAQTKVQRITGREGLGGFAKIKFAQLNLVATASETTATVTPADAGMAGFIMWSAVDQSAAAAVRIVPTYVGNLCTSLAFTFTAGSEVDLFLMGV